jgi:hypothetical protein
MTMTAFDRWLTTEPEDNEPTITCPNEDCAAELLVSALAWTKLSEREVEVWGCGGQVEEWEALGYVADCGDTDLHPAHVETDMIPTLRGMCPLCGEELTYEEP